MPDVKAAMTGHEAWIEPGCAERGDAESEFAFRQRRHEVKNILQRILLQIADAQRLRATVCSRWLLAVLLQRLERAMIGLEGPWFRQPSGTDPR